jgi:hypothetical protein
MARERVNAGGAVRFVKYAEANPGDILVAGWYTGKRQSKFGENKYDYEFTTEEGEKVVLNGAGHLAFQMANVKLGMWTEVEYVCKDVIKKGQWAGREAHNFAVYIDAEKKQAGGAEELPF